MKKRRLKSLSDIRKYLSHVLNEYENGQADETKVKTISYACNVLSSIVKDADLEARVDALEKQHSEQQQARGKYATA